jgi:hypothetical protein
MIGRVWIILFSLIAISSPAFSQTFDHTFVSAGATGNCSRTSPCGSLQTAHNATNPGGVLTVLTAGDYNGVSISKSMTVRAVGNDGGATQGSCTNCDAYWIGVNAGPSDIVNLEGIHLAGIGGVLYQSGGKLNITDCVFENGNGTDEAGILLSTSAPAILNVARTTVRANGNGTGGGIVIRPRAGGSALVSLDRVSVLSNAFGIAADGTSSTTGINVTISESVTAGNSQDGVIAVSSPGAAPIGMLLTNVKSSNNSYGVRSIGANVTVRVDSSKIAGDGIGLATSSGGSLLTAGNNIVEANGTNGSFTGSVAPK